MTSQTSPTSPASSVRGAILGLLVGDALGVPYEFHPASRIPALDSIEFEPPEGFDRAHRSVPTGTYSDDGAQALILLDTLLARGHFDPTHFGNSLVDWYENGFMAVDSHVFDVGIQTADSVRAIRRGVAAELAGGTSERSNGNGSLMRVLPLAVWHQGSDAELVADALTQSRVTHAHPRSTACCAIYCLWARRIMEGVDDAFEAALETFRELFPEGSPERDELETNIFPSGADFEIRGTGYVVDSLRAARLLNESDDDYETIVRKAIALGDDTDTTACIAGGIAGLRLGDAAIPPRWLEKLRGRVLYEPLIEKLVARVGGN